MIIAIDGPAGAGKSTIAKIIARELGFLYIDTGAMYRALTLKVLDNNIQIQDSARIIETAKKSTIDLSNLSDGSLKVLLDGKDVTCSIRDPRITKHVSDIAKIKEVRQVMLTLQRQLGKRSNSVLDGRDIGTVVFPDADKKFYLDAKIDERVNRRHIELNDAGIRISVNEVGVDLRNRDNIDSTREFAPLKQAEDAVYIDTTNMAIEKVAQAVLREINNG